MTTPPKIVNDGGPAFPSSDAKLEAGDTLYQGMSLRAYFAGQALQGMLSHPNSDGTIGEFVRWAVDYADEMIRQLSVK